MTAEQPIDDPIVLETASWVVRQLTSYAASVKHCKHSGWCTRHEEDFENYKNKGELFIFRKRGKARPSYQLFIRDNGITEFKHSQNKHADIWRFQQDQYELSGWLGERVKSQSEQYRSLTIEWSYVGRTVENLRSAFAHLNYSTEEALRSAVSLGTAMSRFHGQFDGLHEIDAVESFGNGHVAFNNVDSKIYTSIDGKLVPLSDNYIERDNTSFWVMPAKERKEITVEEDQKPNKGTNSGALHNGRLVNGLRKMRGNKY